MTGNVRLQIVRLVNGVSGHCAVCGEHGIHDHFDRELCDLVCAECKEEVKDAELMLMAWAAPGIQPWTFHELLFHIDFFNRSGARSRPRVSR